MSDFQPRQPQHDRITENNDPTDTVNHMVEICVNRNTAEKLLQQLMDWRAIVRRYIEEGGRTEITHSVVYGRFSNFEHTGYRWGYALRITDPQVLRYGILVLMNDEGYIVDAMASYEFKIKDPLAQTVGPAQ